MRSRRKFSENLRASPFKKDPPIDITFSQIHLAGQYLFKKQENVGHGSEIRPNLNLRSHHFEMAESGSGPLISWYYSQIILYFTSVGPQVQAV
jgi:hypothetical protein